MTYLDEARNALAKELIGIHPELLDFYTVLVYVKGQQVTCEDVHDAWAMWTHKYKSQHRWLIPFRDLPEDVKAKDQPYVDAIKAVAVKVLGADGVPRETSPPANAHEALMGLLKRDRLPTEEEWAAHMDGIARLAVSLDGCDVPRETNEKA